MEVNFCPNCDAPQHKILNYKDYHFCRQCNKFYHINSIALKCPKCCRAEIEDSEYPGTAGEIILQCKKCKKMFTAKEVLEYNKVGENNA